MKKIIFATGSQSKLEDAQKALVKLEYEVVGKKIEFVEIQGLDQEEIVREKARQAYKIIKSPIFVDDTGFYLNSYPQFPGTLTKHVNKTLGLEGFSKLFDEGQTAYFKTLICLIDGKSEIMTEGKLTGRLTKNASEKFNPETPLNSIFIPDGYDKPLIELMDTSDVGNSHRINALKKLCEEMQEYDKHSK